MSYIYLDGLSRWCWENYCDFSKVSLEFILVVLKINIPKYHGISIRKYLKWVSA